MPLISLKTSGQKTSTLKDSDSINTPGTYTLSPTVPTSAMNVSVKEGVCNFKILPGSKDFPTTGLVLTFTHESVTTTVTVVIKAILLFSCDQGVLTIGSPFNASFKTIDLTQGLSETITSDDTYLFTYNDTQSVITAGNTIASTLVIGNMSIKSAGYSDIDWIQEDNANYQEPTTGTVSGTGSSTSIQWKDTGLGWRSYQFSDSGSFRENNDPGNGAYFRTFSTVFRDEIQVESTITNINYCGNNDTVSTPYTVSNDILHTSHLVTDRNDSPQWDIVEIYKAPLVDLTDTDYRHSAYYKRHPDFPINN